MNSPLRVMALYNIVVFFVYLATVVVLLPIYCL